MGHATHYAAPLGAAVLSTILAMSLGAQGTPAAAAPSLHIEHEATIPPGQVQPSSRRDVAITARGTSYLLDARSDRVYAFTRSGQLRTTLVLTPANAASHVAGFLLAPYRDDGLLVYDAFGGRVHAYRWKSPTTLAEVADVSVGAAMAKDLCAIGDTVFLLADEAGHMIHAYGLSGGRGRSFGEAPGSNRFVRSALIGAGGHLTCLRDADAVVVGLAASGLVEAYHANGSLLWKFAVPGFSGLDLRTMPDSSVQMSWQGAARDAVVSVFGVAPDTVAVQVRRLAAPGGGLQTILVRIRDGHSLGAQQDLPMMRRAAGAWMISTEDVAPLHADVYAIRGTHGGK